MKRFQAVSPNLLRIIAGFLLLQHGLQKLFGLLGRDAVELASLSGLAGALEFFGGIAVIVGLGTKPVAFILSGELAVAYFHGACAARFLADPEPWGVGSSVFVRIPLPVRERWGQLLS